MNDTPKYFGVHTSPHSADPVAFDAACATLTGAANRTRYTAQSILTGIVDRPEPPTLKQAEDIISWANRNARK